MSCSRLRLAQRLDLLEPYFTFVMQDGLGKRQYRRLREHDRKSILPSRLARKMCAHCPEINLG